MGQANVSKRSPVVLHNDLEQTSRLFSVLDEVGFCHLVKPDSVMQM